MSRSIGRDFNPRSPYGERLLAISLQIVFAEFQSTLPLRGATFLPADRMSHQEFQSTLPLRGATRAEKNRVGGFVYFNPRSPYGERLTG